MSNRPRNRKKTNMPSSRERNRRKKSKFTYEDFHGIVSGIAFDVKSFFSDLRTGNLNNLHPGERKRKTRVVSIVLCFFIAIVSLAVYGTVWSLTHKNAQSVFLNGELIGIVDELTVTPEDIYNTALAKLKATFDENTVLQVFDEVTTAPVHAKKSETSVFDYITTEVYKKFTYKVQAAVIYVEAKKMAIVNNEEEANLILDNIKSEFLQSGINIVRSEFVEVVEISPEFVDKTDIISIDEAKEILTAKTDVEKSYEVAPGDNLSIIAENASMSLKDLLAINPSVDPAIPLQIGQKIVLHVPKPLISVRTTEERTYYDIIPKKTEYKEISDKPRTHTKVLQQGKDGQSEVTAEIYRVNGFEEGERKIIKERVIIEPITEIIEIGKSASPPKSAMGLFYYPAPGTLTESFGSVHKGIDLAGPRGSLVKASDGGIVKLAASNAPGYSGYGYVVIIDHENGFETLYAHNSAVLAEEGQRVAQGEIIALMGSTGDSSGSHCHFEIRKDGVPVNPFKYLV